MTHRPFFRMTFSPSLLLSLLFCITHSSQLYPNSVVGIWLLSYPLISSCPSTIEHRYWRILSNSTIHISHNNIFHDAKRCSNPPSTPRLFRLFPSARVLFHLSDKSTTTTLPRLMLRRLQLPSMSTRLFSTLNDTKEPFYVGFEDFNRVCSGEKIFKRATIAFVFHPRASPISLPPLPFTLTTTNRWLTMFTANAHICVYSPIDSYPSPSKDPKTGFLPPFDSEEETPKPTPTPKQQKDTQVTSSGTRSCFPANAVVMAESGGVRVDMVRVGDRVVIARNTSSAVFFFTHRLPSAWHAFVRIHTAAQHLDVSGGHYVYANDKLVRAGNVKVGDLMTLHDGSKMGVVRISRVVLRGLFNPQTLHGDIIVNGFRVSTYTEAVEPTMAHSLLAPFRAAFRVFSGSTRWLY